MIIFSQSKERPGFDDITVGIEIPFLVDISQIDGFFSVIEDAFPFAPLELHIAQVQVGNCFKLDIFRRSGFTKHIVENLLCFDVSLQSEIDNAQIVHRTEQTFSVLVDAKELNGVFIGIYRFIITFQCLQNDSMVNGQDSFEQALALLYQLFIHGMRQLKMSADTSQESFLFAQFKGQGFDSFPELPDEFIGGEEILFFNQRIHISSPALQSSFRFAGQVMDFSCQVVKT